MHVNGTLVDSGATDTPEGFTKTKVVDVSVNDTIDLALTPVGPNGDRSDGSDGSFFSMTISTISTGTDPLLADSDGDGYDDGDEIQAGSDPSNSNLYRLRFLHTSTSREQRATQLLTEVHGVTTRQLENLIRQL